MQGRSKLSVAAAAAVLSIASCVSSRAEAVQQARGGKGGALPVEEVTIADEIFVLEIAASPASRERGLMGRADLAPDQGMLFVFADEVEHSFWMAHTLTDLDIIFLDDHGVITAMHTMAAEPPQRDDESEWHYHRRLQRYPSRSPARFAIEFKAGTLGLLALVVGDTVALDWDRLRALARE